MNLKYFEHSQWFCKVFKIWRWLQKKFRGTFRTCSQNTTRKDRKKATFSYVMSVCRLSSWLLNCWSIFIDISFSVFPVTVCQSLLPLTSSSCTSPFSSFNHLDLRSSFLHDPELLASGESRSLVGLMKGQLWVLAQLRLLNNGQWEQWPR